MLRLIERALAWFAGATLLLMMLLTFVDVVGRYGFNKPVFGSAEFIEILMVFTVFAGLACITRTNDHIFVSLFESWIARTIPNVQRWSVLIFSLIAYSIIAYSFWRLGLHSLTQGRLTPVLSLPQAILPLAAAACSTLGVLLFAAAIVLTRGHPMILFLANSPRSQGQ